MRRSRGVTDQEIIEACRSAECMVHAIEYLQMNHNTFRSRAKKLGCYEPNQGWAKNREGYVPSNKKAISDYLVRGKRISTSKIRKKLLSEGIKENKCENCGVSEWMDEELTIQLHHIDGDTFNNTLDNLQMLCPNCHSQTENHSVKKLRLRSPIGRGN